MSRSSVYRLIASGSIPSVHVGPAGRTRISEADLSEYINRHRLVRDQKSA
jgi:excisionase family DNA binding protein